MDDFGYGARRFAREPTEDFRGGPARRRRVELEARQIGGIHGDEPPVGDGGDEDVASGFFSLRVNILDDDSDIR